MDTTLAIVAAAGCAASGEDLWRRRVSNWIPLTTFVLAFALRIPQHGAGGLFDSLAGAAVGFLIFLAFHLLGGLGGGDIKLMTAFGATLGPQGIVIAAVFAAVFGAVHALVSLCWLGARDIPYAPSISLGALLAALATGATA
jgi:prepilin peptidase CpaA